VPGQAVPERKQEVLVWASHRGLLCVSALLHVAFASCVPAPAEMDDPGTLCVVSVAIGHVNRVLEALRDDSNTQDFGAVHKVGRLGVWDVCVV
jgi:hypothetical protein